MSISSIVEHIINEITFNDLRVKQRTINQLFPSFGSRVKAVAANGGVRMREQMPDYWHFEVASGTKPGIKYDVYVQFLNLEPMIRKYASDKRLWNKSGDDVDLRLLAAEVLNKVDMKTSCSCPATLYWGQDYIRTQRDAQFGRQENRPPNIRNPRQYGAYCKHGQNVFNVLPAYTTTFASFLKKFWLQEITDTVALAKEETGMLKKAAIELGQRAPGVRPASFTRGGREVPAATRAPRPEEAPEIPAEEAPPEIEVPGPERAPQATKGAGQILPKATKPGVKKLDIEPEVRPPDAGRKGKYKPTESVTEAGIFKHAPMGEVDKRRARALKAHDEDLLVSEHDKEGLRIFGRRSWRRANFGWVSGGGSICSKVYSDPIQILCSKYVGDKIVHEVQER